MNPRKATQSEIVGLEALGWKYQDNQIVQRFMFTRQGTGKHLVGEGAGWVAMTARWRSLPFPNPDAALVYAELEEWGAGRQGGLTPQAKADAAQFEAEYSDRGCTCFISAPCSYCTHPGHPIALEDDSCYEVYDDAGREGEGQGQGPV